MKKVTAVLLGAGDRGMNAYGSYALANPDEVQFIAVAEPREDRRRKFQQLHGIKDEMGFANWEDLLNRPRMADAVLITTWDKMHFQPAVKAIEKGYHIFLEKPISTEAEECLRIGDLAKKYDKVFMLGYVMRYMWYMQTSSGSWTRAASGASCPSITRRMSASCTSRTASSGATGATPRNPAR